jgi:general secretion pathway protein A
MDLAYWGFFHWPFQRQQLDELHSGASHEEALARLAFLIDERRTCGLMTGIAGIGKSCLLRQVRAYAARQGRVCLEMDATGMDQDDFVWQLAHQMDANGESEVSTGRAWSRVQQKLACLALVGQPIVVLIDHLDQIPAGTIPMVRRLLNLAELKRADLTLLLAARTSGAVRELSDLLDLTVEVTPWTEAETSRFVRGALNSAGAVSAIFSTAAVAAIHEFSRGVPREVSRICDLSLLAAMNDGQKQVDEELVRAVIEELRPQPISTSDRLPAGLFV